MAGLKKIQEESVDIRESEILSASPELLNLLLSDHTTNHNIFWATKDYASNGPGYDYKDEITPAKITGDMDALIMPRVLKEKQLQQARIRDKAEVFTPSWICNAQNNLVDNAWFGREGIFNEELEENGVHSWSVNLDKVKFPKGKTWKAYVKSIRLEITCGEAPYLVSRYDTTTGDYIPVPQRIGLLDRKLRVVGENTSTPEEWKEKPHKLAQKDVDARWTKKGDERHFGYKNHVKVDSKSKMILDYRTTAASVHDSNCFGELLDKDDRVIYADSGYVGKEIPAHIKNEVCERRYRGKPLNEKQKAENRRKSKIRCRIEHVFGFMTVAMRGITVRSIGIRRAEFVNGLTNLVYNMFRFAFLRRKCFSAG